MPSSANGALTLTEALLGQLREQRWRPGERLPTERELCRLYQLGRSAVRRALGELKSRGLITQTVGSGTYVAPDVAARLPPAAPGGGISPAELMEARIVFEPGIVDLIVRNATAADLAGLAACCRNADTAETLEQFELWDSAFHARLADATHNSFVIAVFTQMAKAREHGDWGLLKRRSATAERRAAYQREHWALHAALADRDAEAARRVLAGHLGNVRRNMFE